MAVTIKVNGTNLSLVHKGSMGIVKSTLPDVCKTPMPGGPVPVPYPVIISLTQDLIKGSKSVTVDGGNSAAIKGSELSRCSGDEPGTAGGIKSSTQMKQTAWLSYSFDVMIEGKNACRLSDKLQMNNGNTVCLAGVLQDAFALKYGDVVTELESLCIMMCQVKDLPGPKQSLIAAELKAIDALQGGRSTMKAEIPFNPITVEPYPDDGRPPWRYRGSRRPDVVITDGGPPTSGNIRRVVEMKFKDSNTTFSKEQIQEYEAMFGDKLVVMKLGDECICYDEEPEPIPIPVPAPERKKEPATEPTARWSTAEKVGLGVAIGVLAVATVALALCPADGPAGEVAMGSATLALYRMAFGAAAIAAP